MKVKFRRKPWRTRLLSLDSHKGLRHQADIVGRLTVKAKLYFTLFWAGGEGRLGSMFKQRDQLFPYSGEVKMWYFSFCHFQRILQGSHEKPHVRGAATVCLAEGEIFLPPCSRYPGSRCTKPPADLSLQLPENQTTSPPSPAFVKEN